MARRWVTVKNNFEIVNQWHLLNHLLAPSEKRMCLFKATL
jgi:hypothetical protein